MVSVLLFSLGCSGAMRGTGGGIPGDLGVESGDTPLPGPAAWRDDAAFFTVGLTEGLTWEVDKDFRLEGFAVPQLFIAPDGRTGMFATHMAHEDFLARSVLWSSDGLIWEEGGPILEVQDFPYECGDRLEDATMWREDANTWTVVVEGTPMVEGGEFSQEPRHFCAASTSDMESFSYSDGPLFSGATEDDRPSVPAILEIEELGSFLWYNGDVTGASPEGPGIRLARIEPGPHAVEIVYGDPILSRYHVDPMPVYLEEGGVRLYTTYLAPGAGCSGIRATDLDAALLPTGTDHGFMLASSGQCDPAQELDGRCLMDPTLVHAADGTLLLYFSDVTFSADDLDPGIGRAIAVDPG